MIRASVNIDNLIWWYLYGDEYMQTHFCKLAQGFVNYDFDCEGCKMCEHYKQEGE